MTYLSVTKFEQYQHYTQRRPPWVKFYVKLLEPDNPLMRLPVSTRYLFHMLLLLAAECDNAIPNDFEWLSTVCECRRTLAGKDWMIS